MDIMPLRTCLLILTGIFLGLVGFTAHAQPRTPGGLDALNDDALMNALAARGLDALLEHAFQVNNVPEAERQGRRTLIALSRLADPQARLTHTQRQRLVNDVVKGIEVALPTLNDPRLLLSQADMLITQAIAPEVNTLEYWGENPRTQATLRPIVQTVIKLLDRAKQRAETLAEELGNRITGPTDPTIQQFEAMDQLVQVAEFTRYMIMYHLSLSLDRADPQRRQIADNAIEYLRQFDTDGEPLRNSIRNRMAKLMLTKGDYHGARKMFEQVINEPSDPTDTANQYEARYFRAVAYLLDRKPDEAEKKLDEVDAWTQANLPDDPQAQSGVKAASAMLRYRIVSARAEAAPDAQTRRRHNDQAVAILVDLVQQQPALRTIIFEQLLARLDDATPLDQLDPLVLRALVERAERHVQRAEDEPREDQVLHRGIAAAREILTRRGQDAIDGQTLDTAALLIGVFLEDLDQPAEAALAFLDYVEQFKTSRTAPVALDQAQFLIGQLRASEQRDEPAAARAYRRFFPIAIAPPFNRRQFAFEYAQILQRQGDFEEAARFYDLVPEDHPRHLQAQYFRLVALKQRLDELSDAAEQRKPLLTEIQQLADVVNQRAQQALAAAANDQERQIYRNMLVRTPLLAADLARREQRDPARAIQLLSDFEQQVAGAQGQDALLADAMFIRVQSYMALGRNDDATRELVRLLEKTGGEQGAQIVYNLLERLNDEFDRAQADNDLERMRVLARNRADLSGFLVSWAQNNPNPRIRELTYRYRVFDADTQRIAATLETDPSRRRELYQRALERFSALETPENVAAWRRIAAANAGPYDPTVMFGLAQLHYDLGNYREARDRFGTLMQDRRLGTPLRTIEDQGQTRVVDNDQYWEALLKLIRSNMQLGEAVDRSAVFLKQHFVTWGDRVGGRRWKQEYEQLRKDLIPDFDPSQITAGEPLASP